MIEKDKTNMDSLVTILKTLDQDGYTSQFKAIESGLQSLKTLKVFQASDVKVDHFYRFEGESDPEDSAIAYAIQTSDGEKGTLIDSFGPYADSLVTQFMQKVKEIHK